MDDVASFVLIFNEWKHLRDSKEDVDWRMSKREEEDDDDENVIEDNGLEA